MQKRVFGQDKTINVIVQSIKKKRGLDLTKNQLEVFITGPTGVGKTEVLKELSINLEFILKDLI